MEAIMFYITPGSKQLATDDFNVNLYEPIGSLFEPSIIRLVFDFCKVDDIIDCVNYVANSNTEKMRRKKMMLNIAMDSIGIQHERFKIDSPSVRCNTMKVEHGLITVLYLLKHLKREEVEIVYDLSNVPNEVFDIVKDYKLTFFDRYNPLYLDPIAERYFAPIFEKHGILCYDENDITEYQSILKLIRKL